MAAPLIEIVSPLNGADSVVLGTKVVITFDQLMDTSTINERTFVLTGPGQTSIITPDELISSDPQVVTGREYVPGTFAFATVSSKTVVTFTPATPLRPNVLYDVLVVGSDSDLSADHVQNILDEAMEVSYQWSFTTGDGNIVTPPAPSPLPALSGRIDPASIVVVPRRAIGNDISEIEMIFPGEIDPTSFSLNDILVSIEAMLGDPSVTIPSNLQADVELDGNKITVTISETP